MPQQEIVQKPLMEIRKSQLRNLNETHPETGMNFQIVETPPGVVAVMEDGSTLPCYRDPLHYDISDLVAGSPIPTARAIMSIAVSSVFASRTDALSALRSVTIAPAFTGRAGAIPLIASYVLAVDTIFYRCLSSPTDHRYLSGMLTAGTYLTTALDQTYANSGFATVGRYALPIPLPASHVIQYELPGGTTINVGTVAPMFGQAGGGVEVQLPTAQAATQVGASFVDPY